MIFCPEMEKKPKNGVKIDKLSVVAILVILFDI